jgi:hypothetical protein
VHYNKWLSCSLWYPVSDYCNINVCNNQLQQLFPKAIHTNYSNVHHVTNEIPNVTDISSEDSRADEISRHTIFGTVSCGSKYIAEQLIHDLQTQCEYGPYRGIHKDSCRGL